MFFHFHFVYWHFSSARFKALFIFLSGDLSKQDNILSPSFNRKQLYSQGQNIAFNEEISRWILELSIYRNELLRHKDKELKVM
jgi:hypothetical protein